jgi:RES domain-containing protein
VGYTSQHHSLAMLEYFVHLDRDNPPTDLVLAKAMVPERMSRIQIKVADLPSDWRDSPPPSVLTTIGDDFVAKRKSAILIVPSALAPSENNWLLNPLHPDFAKIEVQPVEPFEYDERLFA